MSRQYASLIGPLLGLYLPLPFTDDGANRVALSTSSLASLWGGLYYRHQIPLKWAVGPHEHSTHCLELHADRLDYDREAVRHHLRGRGLELEDVLYHEPAKQARQFGSPLRGTGLSGDEPLPDGYGRLDVLIHEPTREEERWKRDGAAEAELNLRFAEPAPTPAEEEPPPSMPRDENEADAERHTLEEPCLKTTLEEPCLRNTRRA